MIHERRASDERTIVLEQRVSGLGATVGRVETKIDKLGDTLAGIVRIEERQLTNAARISEVQLEVGRQSDRLGKIEVQMPGLTEKAAWIAKAVVATVGIVGAAVVAAVMR